MAHNLLSIVGECELQPICSGNLVIVANAELYNYKDLIPAIQFNLNLCDVKKQDKYRNAYLIQDINKNILTDKLKIYHQDPNDYTCIVYLRL